MPQETPDILIGVDLGDHRIRTKTISPSGEIIDFRKERQNAETTTTSGRALVDQMISAIDGLIQDHSQKSRVLAIGAGFPGLVEHASFRVVNLPHAPSLNGFDFRGEFQKAFGVPVYIENL